MGDKPNLKNYKEHPKMVRWFSFGVLWQAARRSILSAIFGVYADRRLIHAALDVASDDVIKERYQYAEKIKQNSKGETWIDYVADLGDGFDSTYAIAYLLGRKTLKIGNDELPRGQALIMGGDQVYPTATKEDYEQRLKVPYRYAFPKSDRPDAEHPPVFLIPGNHDWYDGLTLFLAMFCRGRKSSLGSWESIQNRSYFAISLKDNWWIWGVDTQLGEDIDQPQANYFAAVAKNMPANAKIILCTSVPTWLKADKHSKDKDERDKFYRGLNYIAFDILKDICPTAKICAVLSGDLHHYSRYSAMETGTQFITAGGGGAFLHPTHHLKDKVEMKWLREWQFISLKTDPKDYTKEIDNSACFPSKCKSRFLGLGNFLFAIKNLSFCVGLGLIYAAFSLLLEDGINPIFLKPELNSTAWIPAIQNHLIQSPMFWALTAIMAGVMFKYADSKNNFIKLVLSTPHATAHMITIFCLVSILPTLNMKHLDLQPGTLLYFSVYHLELILGGGILGGIIWGLYLVIVNFTTGLHNNDAFSAMRLDSYKNFLRLCLKGDQLTIYPVGLEKSPNRHDWLENQKATNTDIDQNEPVFLPKNSLVPILIEGPIMIDAKKIMTINQIYEEKK